MIVDGKAMEIFELSLGELRRVLAFFAGHDREFFYQNNIHEWCEWHKKGTKVFAISKNGNLVALGGISFYNEEGNQTFYHFATVAVLTNAYVFPDFRQQGYHKIIIRQRLSFCLKHGLYKIRALVKDANDRSAKNLQAAGFVYSGHYDYDNVQAEIYVYQNTRRIVLAKIKNYLGTLI